MTAAKQDRARRRRPRAKPHAPAKTAAPRLPPICPRTRLFKWLDRAALRAPIIWIEGPPGAGKTTLVGSWIAARRHRCLWYQIDAGDRDPASVFYHLGLAVQRLAPRYRPMPTLTPEYLAGLPTFSRNFFREIARRLKSPFLIVLDNMQELDGEMPLHDALREGLEQLPLGAHAVLLSRFNPPQAFARCQLEQRMILLDWELLRLRPEESVDMVHFLHRGSGTKVSAERMAALHHQSDGWLAGLLLLLQGTSVATSHSEPLNSVSAQRLFDYFAGEAFNRRPPAVQNFLVQTALYSNFTAAMAERLTGHTRASTLLNELVRQHHFTERRAEKDIHYQYHPLFREFLLERAHTMLEASELAHHRHRAAKILEETGALEAALALFIDADDVAAATRLILRLAPDMAAAGRFNTLHAAISRLACAVIEREPWLLYWLGLCRLAFDPTAARADLERAYAGFDRNNDGTGLYLSWSAVVDSFLVEWSNFAPADRWIAEFDSLRARHPEFPSAQVETRVVPSIILILSNRHIHHSSLPYWLERAEALLQTPIDPSQRGMLCMHLMCYFLWMGSGRAKKILAELQPMAKEQRANPLSRLLMHAVLGAYYWCYGDPRSSLRIVEDGLEIANLHGISIWKFHLAAQGVYSGLVRGDVAGAAISLATLKSGVENHGRGLDVALFHHLSSITAAHQGDLTAATRHADTALSESRQSGNSFAEVCCLYMAANIAFLRGDGHTARTHLSAALALGEEKQSSWIAYVCRFSEIAFAAANGIDDYPRELKEIFSQSRALDGPSLPWLPHAVLQRMYGAALEHGIEHDHVCSLIRRFEVPAPEQALSFDGWPWPLKVYALGPFAVLVDDKPLKFSIKTQKKPLALLKTLIALGGRQVREDRLTELLWPDSEADAGSRALATTLHRLRKLLGEHAIERQDGCLTLDRRRCWVDAWALERTLDELDQACLKKQPQAVMVLTERAHAFYRGAFLASETAASWALSPRERLRAKLLRHLDMAARCLREAAEHDKAITCYQRALEVDPVAESLYRGLMQSYLGAGRTSEALATYERCRQVLHAELGTAPSSDIAALYRKAADG